MQRENGFALLVALLALVGLTALATAGFMVTDVDYRVSQNHRSSVEAFYAADAAQSEYLAAGGVPTGAATFSYGSADADVQGSKLLDLDGGLTLYHVRAAAAHEDPRGGGSIRGVSSVAIFTPLPLTVVGAFTAPNGLIKEGVAGNINGADAAPPGPCPLDAGTGAQAAVAGVAVPPGGYVQEGQGGGKSPLDGDPPLKEDLPEDELLQETRIDWPGLVSEDIVEPDYRITADPWPNFAALPASEWPIIHITESFLELDPTHSGRGTIIADGDLTLNGSFSWRGIILVGGRLVSAGNQTIDGAVFTGLNSMFGDDVGASNLGEGTKTFRFHSCNVYAATRAMGWLATVPGTWTETI